MCPFDTLWDVHNQGQCLSPIASGLTGTAGLMDFEVPREKLELVSKTPSFGSNRSLFGRFLQYQFIPLEEELVFGASGRFFGRQELA